MAWKFWIIQVCNKGYQLFKYYKSIYLYFLTLINNILLMFSSIMWYGSCCVIFLGGFTASLHALFLKSWILQYTGQEDLFFRIKQNLIHEVCFVPCILQPMQGREYHLQVGYWPLLQLSWLLLSINDKEKKYQE